MPKTTYEEQLAAMQDTWEGSKTEHEQMFGSDSVTEGEYILELTKLELKTSQANNLMVGREHIICDGGEFDGIQLYDNMMLETQRNKVFMRRYIDTMGYEPPENFTELPDFLDSILGDKPKVRARVNKTEGKDGTVYTNLIILELLEGDADTSTETQGQDQDQDQDQGSGDTSGTDDADELLANMVAFCTTWDLEVADDSDYDSLKAAIESNEYDNAQLDEEERNLLNTIGLEGCILPDKPAPAKKKAAKKAPPKKAPAKSGKKKPAKRR